MIKRISGAPNIHPHAKAASTVFAFNDVVAKDSTGYLVRATAATPRSEIVGLIQREVLSTDADYASNTLVPVDEIDERDEVEFDVQTGTLTQALVDQAFDLADQDAVDVTKQQVKAIRVRRVISTTKGRGYFRKDGERARLVTYQQTVAFSEFTDGGGAAGTLALAASIPAGAVFARSLIDQITGFTGDTSAVLTIGDGTDVDRYNTGTPSVFTTAAAGVDAGAPSGTLFHSAAKTPTLTVTSATDFGAVSAGAVRVTLFWYETD